MKDAVGVGEVGFVAHCEAVGDYVGSWAAKHRHWVVALVEEIEGGLH